ncbi:hypothetical protein XENORESO_012598, partial [Xenotaenia resolanae]
MLDAHLCQDGLIAVELERRDNLLLFGSLRRAHSPPHRPTLIRHICLRAEVFLFKVCGASVNHLCVPTPTRAQRADARGALRTVLAASRDVRLCASVSLRGSMSDSSSRRRNTHRQLSWLRVGPDGTEFPLNASARRNKWRVGGWVGGLCVKLKEVGMDGKGTLKMFRKKRELIKTPSISKKSRAGSPGPQSGAPSLSILQEQPRKDAADATLSSSPSSSTTSSTLTPSSASFQDSSLSCPGTPSPQHAKLVAMQGVGGASPVTTLKRPTALSRHASAAGFPLPSWVYTKGQGKGALSPSPQSEVPESTVIEVEDIPALLRDVARFAEAVEKLKDVVLAEGKESQRPVAHECLGEVLRNLRQVINTYPLLNTVEILTAAGKLISKVKGFHYEASNETDKKDFEKAIETIA